MDYKKKTALVFFMLFLNWFSYSQENSWKNQLYFEGNYHYGFLMPHSDYIAFFVQEHIQGFQLNVGLSTMGDKDWHQSYNFPKLGVGYYHSGLGNRNVYGQLDAIFGYVDRYYRNLDRKFNFGNRLAFGGAFVTKKFDLESNNTNLAIGSRFNAYINYSLETSFRIFPKTVLKLGGGITHISNGNYRQPNKGLNFFTAFSGISYTFKEPVRIVPTNIEHDIYKHQYLLGVSYGRKQISRKTDNSYTVLGISGEYSHVITGNSWGGTSLSFYYDQSLEKEITFNDTVKTDFSDNVRLTFNLSYELKMGKISYVIQPGIYLKNPYKNTGVISNRLSVRYQLNPKLSASLTIKAHWFAIADVFEWGIGYKWRK